MNTEIWKIFVSLGVPGLALGIFFMLFKSFKWEFPKVQKKWVGPIIVLFMVLTFSLVFYALSLWAPNVDQKEQAAPINSLGKSELKLVDISILNSQSDYSTVDLKLKNSGNDTAFIKSVRFIGTKAHLTGGCGTPSCGNMLIMGGPIYDYNLTAIIEDKNYGYILKGAFKENRYTNELKHELKKIEGPLLSTH